VTSLFDWSTVFNEIAHLVAGFLALADARPLNRELGVVCPNCEVKGTKTSTGRTPYLVSGRWCIVCGYKIKPKNIAEVRSQAAIKAAATRAKNVDPGELFG
jgi:hypothetical protein